MERIYPVGVTIEQAINLILEKVSVLPKEQVALQEAFTRILAEEVTALEDIPPFDRSPYDGYAFRAEDVKLASPENPVTLKIIDEIPAGKYPDKTVGCGEAVKILTGAPVPQGADTVEKFESTQFSETEVTLRHSLAEGSNVCRQGEDVRTGEILLEPGVCLDAAATGILAGLGYAQVPCFRRLRAAVISTGSELLPVEAEAEPGKIRNSSAYVIQALLRKWNMDGWLYGIVPDQCERIAGAIEECVADCDVIITTGGVSVGDYDLVEKTLADMGAEIIFWKVDMKPGMAFLAAMYKGTLILALSGNPSAALASLHMVGYPVFCRISGRKEHSPQKCQVYSGQAFKKNNRLRRFIPGRLFFKEGKVWMDFDTAQGNGMISPWMGCSLVMELQKGSAPIAYGDVVTAWYFAD